MASQPKWPRRAAIGSAVLFALCIAPVDSLCSVSKQSSKYRLGRDSTLVGNSQSAVAAVRTEDSAALTDARIVPPFSVETAARELVAATVLAVSIAGFVAFPGAAFADEFGRETEAPTLFTGETVLICKKRGPLGACLETETRTTENDNDKALKYFRDPAPAVKEKYNTMVKNDKDEDEGSELIRRLRQQTEDNREKNAQIVKTKTLMNDQSASFGPFDRQVVILNSDGETFTLLQSAQAMRLKEAGYIKDRRFVKQPSTEVIDQALEGPGLGNAIMGMFGGGGE